LWKGQGRYFLPGNHLFLAEAGNSSRFHRELDVGLLGKRKFLSEVLSVRAE
jgi:hypothetical protein